MDADEMLAGLGSKAALSHEEAARRLGIELLDDDGTRRVTVPRNRSRARVPGWTICRTDLAVDDIEVSDDGHRTTTPCRTVQDLARVLSLEAAVAAADSAVRLGLVRQEALLAVLLSAFGRGSGRLRAVGRLVDGRSESVLESLLRVLLLTSGLPCPTAQHEIGDRTGRFAARVDFCWPTLRLVVEADGFALHSDRLSYRRDRDRLNELERLGWRGLRFTWEDVRGRPEHVVALVRDCLRAAAA